MGLDRTCTTTGQTLQTKVIINVLTRSVGLGHGHVHDTTDILRFGGRCCEATDARLRWRAGGQAVCVVVGAGGHLLGGGVRDEALCDGELGVAELLFHLGVLVGSGQLFVGGGGTLS